MDIQKEFGLILKKLRIDHGLSQEGFALSCDIDRTFMSKIERGKRQPSMITMIKLAKGFNMKPSELMVITLDPLYEKVLVEEESKP